MWRRGGANSTALGRRVRQHCSFASWGKARPEKYRGEPRPEPDSGNPTVRDRRGALGNVAVSGSRARSESDGQFRHGARAQLLSRPIHGGPESWKAPDNRHEDGNARVLRRRSSQSRRPRSCVGDPRGRSEALVWGVRRPGYAASKWGTSGVPTRSWHAEGDIAGGVLASRLRTPRGRRARACV